jgi:hypothetical protein
MECHQHINAEIWDRWAIWNHWCKYFYYYLVGQGAYAMVVAARDKEAKDKERSLVAIKKIDKAF